MAIGERIHFFRLLRGMTQKYLGMALGFPEKSADVRLAQYETGSRTPKAQNFMRVEEVAQELGISKSHAYKVINKLNAELREKGYLTISGRVNRNFFMEKFCYGKTKKEG